MHSCSWQQVEQLLHKIAVHVSRPSFDQAHVRSGHARLFFRRVGALARQLQRHTQIRYCSFVQHEKLKESLMHGSVRACRPIFCRLWGWTTLWSDIQVAGCQALTLGLFDFDRHFSCGPGKQKYRSYLRAPGGVQPTTICTNENLPGRMYIFV